MAHKWQVDTGKTKIAATREVMSELFPDLQSKISRADTPDATNKSLTTQTSSTAGSLNDEGWVFRWLSSSSYDWWCHVFHSVSGSATSKNAGDKLDRLLYHVATSTFSPFTNSPKLFTDRLTAYLNAQFSVKIDIKSRSAQQVICELTGRSENTREAEAALNSLFSSIKTKLYSKQSHGKFNLFRGELSTSCKILSASVFACPNLFHVVQWQFSRASILASCGFVKKDGGRLSVKYYAHQSPFGVKDEELDAIVLRRLASASEEIPYLTPNLCTQLKDLEKNIQKRPDHGHEICCWFEYQQESDNRSKTGVIYLYGKQPLVQQCHADIKSVMNKYMPKLHNVALSPFSVRIWHSICSVRTFRCCLSHSDILLTWNVCRKADTVHEG